MHIRAILQRRNELRTELQTLFDTAPDGADLSPEARTRADEITAEAARLDEAERRQAALDDLARTGRGTPLGGSPERRADTVRVAGRDVEVPSGFDGRILETQAGQRVPILEARHRLADFLPAEDRAPISFGAFLRCLHSGPRDDVERRAMGEASIGAGGAMVPTPLSLLVIDLLRSKSTAFRAGVGTIPMDSATEKFARQTADPVGGWRNEAAPIPEGTPAFDQATLTARSWALVVKVSRELLEDAQNLDTVLQNSFGQTAGIALDHAILWGSGIAPEPLGIANTVGIQVVDMGAAAGGQLTDWVPFLDAVELLEGANAGAVSAAIMAPRSARVLNGLTDTLGQPLQRVDRIANVPLLSTTAASITETHGTAADASSILLGDFTQVMCGMRTSLQINTLTERYADTGQVGYLLWLRADVLVQHPAAMAKIAGVIP